MNIKNAPETYIMTIGLNNPKAMNKYEQVVQTHFPDICMKEHSKCKLGTVFIYGNRNVTTKEMITVFCDDGSSINLFYFKQGLDALYEDFKDNMNPTSIGVFLGTLKDNKDIRDALEEFRMKLSKYEGVSITVY